MFKKVYAIRARHMFVEGQTIYMCACNLRPEMFAVPVNAAMIESEPHGGSSRAELFDRTLMACKYYNCINSETGLRVSCYIKEED